MTKKETKDIDKDELEALLALIGESFEPPTQEEIAAVRVALQRGDCEGDSVCLGPSCKVELGGVELPAYAMFESEDQSFCSEMWDMMGNGYRYSLSQEILKLLAEAGFDECQAEEAGQEISLAVANGAYAVLDPEKIGKLTLWIEPGERGVREFLMTDDDPEYSDNPTPDELQEAIAGFRQHLEYAVEEHMEWVDVQVMSDDEPPLDERVKPTWQSKGGGVKCFVQLHDEERRVLDELITEVWINDYMTFENETPYVPERVLTVMEKIHARLQETLVVLRTSRVEAFEEKHGSGRRGMIFGMQRSHISCSAGSVQFHNPHSIEFTLGDFVGTIRQDVLVEPNRIQIEMFELVHIDAVKGDFGRKIREASTVHRSVFNLTVDSDHAEACIPGLLKAARIPVKHIALPWEGRNS